MGLGEIRLGEMGLGEMGLGEMGQNRQLLAVKTASEMTYTVSGGALNSTQSKSNLGQNGAK